MAIRAISRIILEDHLGKKTTEALIRAMGGMEILIPVRPEGKNWQRILEATGREMALEIVRQFRGERIYIPLDAATQREAKHEWVLRQRAAGRSIDEIAADAVFVERRTARWVRRVLQQAKRLDIRHE